MMRRNARAAWAFALSLAIALLPLAPVGSALAEEREQIATEESVLTDEVVGETEATEAAILPDEDDDSEALVAQADGVRYHVSIIGNFRDTCNMVGLYGGTVSGEGQVEADAEPGETMGVQVSLKENCHVTSLSYEDGDSLVEVPFTENPQYSTVDANFTMPEHDVVLKLETSFGIPFIEREWDGSRVVDNAKTCPVEARRLPDNGILTYGWYYVSENQTVSSRIVVASNLDVGIILADGVTLTASKGIEVMGSISIYGQTNDTGALVATGESNGAGIGGYEGTPGTINIHGGKITATGGKDSAGIGGGADGDGGTVNIYGGTVKAYGSHYAAGIGGGNDDGKGGTITIYGGDVTAEAGDDAAGIGGGEDGPGGTITIHAGKVQAVGGNNASGIGGGENAVCGTIAIHGGIVDAQGGDLGAGIGSGGRSKTRSGTITVTGGVVTAKGGSDGAGIGAGKQGIIDQIEISGGTITATGGHYAAGIGGGNRDDSTGGHAGNIHISGGTITAQGGNDGAGIGGGEGGNAGTIVIDGGDLIIARGGNKSAGIGCGEYDGSGDGGTITINAGKIEAYGGHSGAGIGGGENGRPDLIEINGGDVYAKSGYEAAGIGGGDTAKNNEILITGGTIMAIADAERYGDNQDISNGRSGAGIGGGAEDDGGKITITGGSVTASSYIGAGIGGGEANTGQVFDNIEAGDGGTITITGGTVMAYSEMAFGIGSGGDMHGKYNTDSMWDSVIASAGNITIDGTAQVIARGAWAGIGGDSGTINIKGGRLYADDYYSDQGVHETIRVQHSAGVLLLSSSDAKLNFTGGTFTAVSNGSRDPRGGIYLKGSGASALHFGDGMGVTAGAMESSAALVPVADRGSEAISESNHFVRITACEHVFDENGVCTLCGWTNAPFDQIKYSFSLTLEERIGVNLYIKNLPEGTNPTDYTVRWWTDGEPEAKEAGLTTAGSNRLSLADFAAKEMCDQVHVQVFYGAQAEPVGELDYSVRRYCDKAIETSDDPALVKLCQAVLDYGTFAQRHFGYGTDDLANAHHSGGTEERVAAAEVPGGFEASSTGACSLVSHTAASVSLDSQVAVNLYLTPAEGKAASDVTLTVDGRDLSSDGEMKLDFATAARQTLADGRVHVSVTGVAPVHHGDAFEFVVGPEGDAKTVSLSVLSYAYSKQSGGSQSLAGVCRALYNYHLAAEAYMASRG